MIEKSFITPWRTLQIGKHVRPNSRKMQLTIFTHSFPRNPPLLLLLLLLIQTCSNFVAAAAAGSAVEFLPGLEGPLPFELETGYIGVGESEDVQLFYHFIKSESNPETDPLVLWLTGGPGCSSFSGLVFEIGPIRFEQVLYHEVLPNLVLNPHSWTKVASIIFLDQPAGAGFSYARTANASHCTDLKNTNLIYEFLQKWLVDYPEFVSNPFYVGGDSYSGITVPIVTQLISDGNDGGNKPTIDLKGYILGNPKTSPVDEEFKIPFAHRMALISDELYEALKVTCKGKYLNIDPGNVVCAQNIETYQRLVSNIYSSNILEPNCAFGLPKPKKPYVGSRRSSIEMYNQKSQEIQIQDSPEYICRDDIHRLVNYWANDASVQEALHVRKDSIRVWTRCNHGLPYFADVFNVVPYHANLSIKGYRSLIYSGDHDMVIPHLGTQAWIRSLNYNIMDDWRPWSHGGQVAGYTRNYANKMTFATVKGAGHCAPEYKPAECLSMLRRWLSYQPL